MLLYGKNNSKRKVILRKGVFFMKKISFAVIAAVLFITVIFAACGGTDSGKVTDPAHNDPILTTLEEMMTEAKTDMESMMSGIMPDSSSSTSDTSSTTLA